MGRWISRYGHGLVAAVLITLVTGYALLDVFVIPHEYAGVANAAGKQREAGSTSAGTEAEDFLFHNVVCPGEDYFC